MFQNSSKIFVGYRALGVNADHVPCIIRYNKKHQETYAITSVGKAFHVYKCSNVGLVRVSDTLENEINCLASDTDYIYAAESNKIHAFRFGRKVIRTYEGHKANVLFILPFSSQLIAIDESNELKIWNIETKEEYLTLKFDKTQFEISCCMHPATYLNKILLGSKQGSLQLWNIKTSKLIYTFKSFQSAINIIQQAPAVNVVGIGLENGRIIIHNLKYDETIMSFVQDWGPVTSLAFRTDGNPVMISGSNLGHLAIWNLEDKRLIAQVREAHNASVTGMQTLQLEPLMVTSSSDNSIKIWIFDMPDGSCRLLRQRHGHHQSPTKIRFHGQNGTEILSAGLDSCLMSFSTDHDSKNKSLGRASFNKLETKRTGLKLDEHKMPPIIDFASEESKQSDWDGIVCIHQGIRLATTWDFSKSTMGKHKLDHERFATNEEKYRNEIATCCTLTSCGNFCLIGYSSGHVDKYNIQSGIHRGFYGEKKAHLEAVRGVTVDSLNRMTITASDNGEVIFWHFKNKQFSLKNLSISQKYNELKLDESISMINLHRDSGMLAIAQDDFTVVIVDIDTQKVIRKFSGHFNKISDMSFTSDARWLLTASMDCSIKIWDLPSARLIDCILFENAPISVSMSPASEFLATAHVNQNGIYLWSNKTLYTHVALRSLPADYMATIIKMPETSISSCNDNTENESQIQIDNGEMDEYKVYESPEQIASNLVTLSQLADSRWKNLINLDIIRQRNKPKEPPKVPKLAPFFLPTVSTLTGFSFDRNDNKDPDGAPKSKISKLVSLNMLLSDFSNTLLKAKSNNDCKYNRNLSRAFKIDQIFTFKTKKYYQK
jgi:U3 small nucleolar RNA-associated protein 21